jgi:hypothetical protein
MECGKSCVSEEAQEARRYVIKRDQAVRTPFLTVYQIEIA